MEEAVSDGKYFKSSLQFKIQRRINELPALELKIKFRQPASVITACTGF